MRLYYISMNTHVCVPPHGSQALHGGSKENNYKVNSGCMVTFTSGARSTTMGPNHAQLGITTTRDHAWNCGNSRCETNAMVSRQRDNTKQGNIICPETCKFEIMWLHFWRYRCTRVHMCKCANKCASITQHSITQILSKVHNVPLQQLLWTRHPETQPPIISPCGSHPNSPTTRTCKGLKCLDQRGHWNNCEGDATISLHFTTWTTRSGSKPSRVPLPRTSRYPGAVFTKMLGGPASIPFVHYLIFTAGRGNYQGKPNQC